MRKNFEKFFRYYSQVIQHIDAKDELVPFMVDPSTALRSPSPFRGGTRAAAFPLTSTKLTIREPLLKGEVPEGRRG